MRKLNYYDSDDRSDMEVSAYDQQLFDEAGWAPVAAELADRLRDDEAKMAEFLEAVRLTIDNGMRQVGIKALLDLVHPVREREAERAVAKACGVAA